jgi:hypothetical protein
MPSSQNSHQQHVHERSPDGTRGLVVGLHPPLTHGDPSNLIPIANRYMNDHPMAHAAQLSPSEVSFRYDGLTSLFDLGLDFWWYDENWGGIIPGLDFGGGEVRVMALSTKLMVFARCVNDCSHIHTHTHTRTHTHTHLLHTKSFPSPTDNSRSIISCGAKRFSVPSQTSTIDSTVCVPKASVR